MNGKNSIESFKYFIEQYWYGMNKGGTFSLEELIEEFRRFENRSIIDSLKNEAQYLKDVLAKEDWEIEKSRLDYLLKKGSKNRMKRIVNCLMEKL
jgi:hypothetical protein